MNWIFKYEKFFKNGILLFCVWIIYRCFTFVIGENKQIF